MPVIRKLRPIANDKIPKGIEKIACVNVRHNFWTPKKIFTVAALSGLAAIIIGAICFLDAASGPKSINDVAAKTSLTRPVQNNAHEAKPDSIAVNASDLIAPEAEQRIAAVLPPAITGRKSAHSRRQASPAFQIEVADDVPAKTADLTGDDQAVHEDKMAQSLAESGDTGAALDLERRVTERAPRNALYRLHLAILYDRAGDKKKAVGFYRQVVEAYNAEDETLPPTIGIDNVRHRLAYLDSKALSDKAN